ALRAGGGGTEAEVGEPPVLPARGTEEEGSAVGCLEPAFYVPRQRHEDECVCSQRPGDERMQPKSFTSPTHGGERSIIVDVDDAVRCEIPVVASGPWRQPVQRHGDVRITDPAVVVAQL